MIHEKIRKVMLDYIDRDGNISDALGTRTKYRAEQALQSKGSRQRHD